MTLARWHTGTKAQTLVFLLKLNLKRSDVIGISDGMAEMEDEEAVSDWDVCVLECRICGHRHTAIVPHAFANGGSECSNCQAMTADVVECEP